MAELDRSVHEDTALASQEVDLALALAGQDVRSIFLPCCGAGRHIPRLLERGVKEIAGVDLCLPVVTAARERFAANPRVILSVGDLRAWQNPKSFDAVFLLGNSWGDIVATAELERMTANLIAALKPGGTLVMDYIGEGSLDQCGTASEWRTTFKGVPAIDRRSPHFHSVSRVMEITVEVISISHPPRCLWHSTYQKLVLSRDEVPRLFGGVVIQPMGLARNHIPSHRTRDDLGMLARSTWWVGRKEVAMGR